MKKINFFISSILILSMFSNVGIIFAQRPPATIIGTPRNTPTAPSTPNTLPTGPSSSAPTVAEETTGASCTGLNNFIANSAKLGSIKNGAQLTIQSEAHKQIANLSAKLSADITKQASSLIKSGVGAIGGLFKSKDAKNADAFKKASASVAKDAAAADAADNAILATAPTVPDNSLTGKTTRIDESNASMDVPSVDKTVANAVNKSTDATTQAGAANTTAVVAADKTKQQQDCNDLFAYYTNKGVLADMVQTTLNWINTGNAGTPFYVLDQASYFKSIFQQTLDKTINADTSSDYLGGQVNKLLISQMTGKTPNYNTNSTNPAAIAYNNFNKDFKSGGWDSWINTSMGDNPISRYLTTVNQISRESSNKQQIAQQELLQGGGFLGQKTCAKDGVVKDRNGNNICEAYSTSIPGSIIKAQAEMATTTQMRQLELADKMNQTLGGIFDDMFNKLISGGFTSMQGSTNTNTSGGIFNSSGGFGVNAVLDSQGNTITNNAGGNDNLRSAYQYSLGGGQGVSIDDITNTLLLAQILKDQYAITNRLEDNVVISKRLLENDGKLDYFLPGPNSESVQYVVDNLNKVSNALPQYGSQYAIGSGGLTYAINPLKNKATFVSDNGASNIDVAIDQIETLTPYLTYRLGDPVTNSYIKYNPWYVLSFLNINQQTVTDTQSNGKAQNAAIGSSVGSAIGSAVAIIPGVGLLVAGIARAFGGLFGGLLGGLFGSNDKHSWYQRDPVDRDSIINALGTWLDDYWSRVSDIFSTDNLILVYLGVDQVNTPGDIRGFVKDAKTETSNLLTYNNQADGIETAYKDNIDTMDQNTAKLADIYDQVQAIVQTAKDRHIAQMAAQGITVNTDCLNQNYYTGVTPSFDDPDIARKEMDNNSDLADLNKYQTMFYTNLCSAKNPTASGALVNSSITSLCELPKKITDLSVVQGAPVKQTLCIDLGYNSGTGNDVIGLTLMDKGTLTPVQSDTAMAVTGTIQTGSGPVPFSATFPQGTFSYTSYLSNPLTIYDFTLDSIVPSGQTNYTYSMSCY